MNRHQVRPPSRSLFLHPSTYVAITLARHAVTDALWAAALFAAAFFGDAALSWPATASDWERPTPGLVAVLVFLTVRRMGTLQFGEPTATGLVRNALCHALVISAAAVSLVGGSGSLWQRYGPLIVAVELARRLRRRADRHRGALRKPTKTGFRPSRRTLLTLPGWVALRIVRTTDTGVRGVTTNLAETEFDAVAARFRGHGDIASAAWALARGIEYMLDQNRLTDAETRSTAAMNDPVLRDRPAVLGARALFLASVGLPAQGLELLERAGARSDRVPTALRALLLEFECQADRVTGRQYGTEWSRAVTVWRGHPAAVVLGLAVEVDVEAGTSPEQQLEAVYRICGLTDEVTFRLGAAVGSGDYQRMCSARGLALVTAARIYRADGNLAAAASADLDASKAFETRRDRTRVGECLVRASTTVVAGGYDGVAQENHALDILRAGLQFLEEDRGLLRGEGHRAGWLQSRMRLYTQAFDHLVGGTRSQPAKAGELGLWLLESMHRTMTGQVLRDAAGLRSDSALLAAMEQLRQVEGGGGDPWEDKRSALALAGVALGNGAPHADAATLREDVAARLSHWREAAKATEPVDMDDLTRRIGDRAAIVYHCRREVAGWRVRSAFAVPEQPVRVHRALIAARPEHDGVARFLTAAGALDVLEDADPDDIRHLYNVPLDEPLWQELADALLPPAWWEHLCSLPEGADLLVVPDGPIAGLPLSVLPVKGGRPLLEYAAVALIPALGLLREAPEAAPRHRPVVVTHLDTELAGTALEAQRWLAVSDRVDLRDTDDMASLLDALAARPTADLAMISTHGSAIRAFGRALRLRDGSHLSAAAAIGVRWPATVILGACWVNAMEVSAGREPFGFPLACLLGGAHTVVGGIAPIDDRGTAGTLAAFIDTVPHASPNAGMVRTAALRTLRGCPDPGELAPVDLAGLVVWTVAAPAPLASRAAYRSYWEPDGSARSEQPPPGVYRPPQPLGPDLERLLAHRAEPQQPLDTRAFTAAVFPDDPLWRSVLDAAGPPDAGAEAAAFGTAAVDTGGGPVLVTIPLADALMRGIRLARHMGQPPAPGHVVYPLLFDERSTALIRRLNRRTADADALFDRLMRHMSWQELPDPALLLIDGGKHPGDVHDERFGAVSPGDAYWEQRSLASRTPWRVPVGAAALLLLIARAGGLMTGPHLPPPTGEAGIVVEETTDGRAEVTAVLPGEPAAIAGVRPQDRVAAVDSTASPTASAVIRLIRGQAPGRHVTLDLLRAGRPLRLTLTVTAPRPPHREGRLGVTLRNDGRAGAAVVGTAPGGAAAGRLVPGDLILAVDDSPAESAAGITALVRAHAPGETVDVSVLHGAKQHVVVLVLT